MSDFLLTPEGDLAIVDGDLVLVEGAAAVAQDITMTLRTWMGESVYDRSAGVPYVQVLFERGTTPEARRFVLERVLLRVDRVTEILSLDVTADLATREMTVTGAVRIDTGERVAVDFTGATP